MWLQMNEKAPFRVVEIGAGSGQLAHDIQECVKRNELGIDPPVWRRFLGAFEYVIVERSPALSRRQRQRGLRVVNADAQRKDSCPVVLEALTQSDACSAGQRQPARRAAAECEVTERGNQHTAASLVLSNELLDAFAPVKLQLSIYGQPVVTHCRAWQEIRLVHIINLDDLRAISEALEHSEQRITAMALDLEGYTNEVFCRVTNTSVGKAAMACAPTSSCLAMVLALSEIMNHHDLYLPAAAHNMRLRLRKDADLCQRLQETASHLEAGLQNSVVIPRQVYRMLRQQLREAVQLEVHFLAQTITRQVPVPLSEERCEDLRWWFQVHEARIQRLIDVYRPLGYPNIQLLLRPGERNFVELVDCLVGEEGFMLAVDYGATFEPWTYVLPVAMAAIFGLFASERATARPAYSLPKLQALHERLQSILEADEQTEAAVEVIRAWDDGSVRSVDRDRTSEQNDHNENFFDFFCEKSILADFVRILGRPVPKTVKVQLLQSLSMLIQNIRRPTSLYYLFSNNYVNQLIATQFDWSDEEILGYYISFLKSLALRLNEETIKTLGQNEPIPPRRFFFQERSQQFPLFTEAVRFFSHHDQMVRTSVRTLTLRVFNVTPGSSNEAMQSFVLKISRPYFRHLAEHLCLLWRTLDESKGQPNALDEANAEQQDLVMYISDVLEMKNANLSRIVVKMVLDHACYPMLLESLAAEDQSLLSWRTALFLLQEFFQTSQQRELSVGVTVNAFSELYRPKILGHLLKEEPLLTAALLRSCLGLGISNLLEQGLLIEAGLLPPLPGRAVTTPAAPAAPPLEVLHRAAAALDARLQRE
eukprot:g20831.t1